MLEFDPENITQCIPTLKAFNPSVLDVFKIILLFPFGFLLLYSQIITIDSQYDQLWKTPLIIGIVLYTFFTKKDKGKYPLFFLLGILFSIKQLLIVIPSQLKINELGLAFLDLYFPALILLFIYNVSYYTIGRLIFYLSSIIILSTIPFHLGIMENPYIIDELSNSLSKYGVEGTLFLGPFNNIHDLAISMSFALFGLLHFYKKNQNWHIKFWILSLAIIGIVSIYLTYVRTAMVMLFVYLLIVNSVNVTRKRKLQGIFFIGLVGLICFYVFQTSTILQLRLADKNLVGGESLSVGSGRLAFWAVTFQLFFESTMAEKLLGIGKTAVVDYMDASLGMRVFTHNGFIDILASYGIIGLYLFIAFLTQVFKRLWCINIKRYLPSYKITLAILLAYCSTIFFQSHQYFWAFPIIAGVVAMLEKEYLLIQTLRKH